MRFPNGYGSISKLSGNRRNPYRVQVTIGWESLLDEKDDPICGEDGKPRKKRIRKTLGYFPNRQAALIALAEYNKAPYDLDISMMTWIDVWNRWGPATIESASRSLAPQLRKAHERCAPLYSLKMRMVRKCHMQDILDSVSHMSETTQARLKFVMQNNFKWAIENDIITKDYSRFLTTSIKKKEDHLHFPFTPEEIKLLWTYKNMRFPLDSLKDGGTTIQAVNAVLVLLYTGMRVMELGQVRAEDVYLDKRYINLQGTKTNAAKRIVPIHKDIIPVVRSLLSDGGEYLVVSSQGDPISYRRWVSKIMLPVNELIASNHTLHDTRHTFISAAERSGLDANSVILKRIVGHSTSGNITARYTHKNVDDLISAIDQVHLF